MPLKSSPNELALTITRYRKSKLSSLVEKFTRRSPSSRILSPPAPRFPSSILRSFLPFPSFDAVYQSNFNLSSIVRAHKCQLPRRTTRNRTNLCRCWKTNSSLVMCVRVSAHTRAYSVYRYTHMQNTYIHRNGYTYRETVAEYERTTPFSYSLSCIRAYSLSVLGQVFTLAFIQRRRIRWENDLDYRVKRASEVRIEVQRNTKRLIFARHN